MTSNNESNTGCTGSVAYLETGWEFALAVGEAKEKCHQLRVELAALYRQGCCVKAHRFDEILKQFEAASADLAEKKRQWRQRLSPEGGWL